LGRDGRGRELREQANLSLRDVAELVGVHISSISRWERGDGRPSRAAAIRWALVCTEIAAAIADDDEASAP
jgi:transcriptional regulator with XRE-family HTH domain